MKTSYRFATALPLALALATVALAADPAMTADSPAVEKLKTKLPSTLGFEVENVRTATDGTACISYHVANGNGGVDHEKAVVDGEKVERSTTGNTRFANAWNKKCVKSAG